MISRAAAGLAGILGGLCWVARFLLDRFDIAAAASDTSIVLFWLGATWLTLALVSGGVRLAREQAVALRLLLGVVAVLLGAVVLTLAYAAIADRLAEAVVGGLLAVASLLALARAKGRADRATDPPGH